MPALSAPTSFPGFPPDGETFGPERAGAIVRYVREHFPPLKAEIEAWLCDQNPHAEPVFSATTRDTIAQMTMHPVQRGIGLGVAYSGLGGNSAIATIVLLRDGTIAWKKVRTLKRESA